MTQVPFGQIAPIQRRAIGYLIDALIAGGIAVVLTIVLVISANLTGSIEGALGVLVIGGPIVSLLLLGWFVFYTFMQAGAGSIGMRAQGLRLISEDGSPLGFGRTLLRNVIFGLTAGIVVGYFTPLFDGSGRFQGWHDKVAKSLMMDARTDAGPGAAHAPGSAAASTSPPAPGSFAPAAPGTQSAPAIPGIPVPPGVPAAPGLPVPQGVTASNQGAPAPSFARPDAAAPGAPFGAPPVPQMPAVDLGAPAAPAYAPPAAVVPPAVSAAPAPDAAPTAPAVPPAPAPATSPSTSAPIATPPAPAAEDDGVIAFVPGITLDAPPPRTAPDAEHGAPAVAPAVQAAAEPPAAPAFPAVPPAPAFPAAPAADVPAPAVAPAAPAASPAVPGVASTTSDVASAAPVPAQPVSSPAGIDDDLEETRISIPGHRLVFTWDDGTRVTVSRRTVFGRNPSPEDGATVVPVRDETLSLSKTHFEAAASTSGGWVLDRFSTNGMTLVREGHRIACPAGQRVPIRLGDAIEIGDRIVTIGGYA